MRILLLEDDERFGPLLKSHLDAAGILTDLSATVSDFDAKVHDQSYDVLLVDLCLPDGDGLDVIRACRRNGVRTPVIVITARNMIIDRVRGLDSGADDFVSKPFHIEELKARIRAILRRPAELQSAELCVGRLTLDTTSGDISFNGSAVAMSPTERRLLALLMRRVGSVVPKGIIDSQVHGAERCNTPNAVEQLVSRLRRSLARSKSGVDVKTVRGIGYVLEERL